MKGWKVAFYFSIWVLPICGEESEKKELDYFRQGETLLTEKLYLDALACYQRASNQTHQQENWIDHLPLRQAICYLELNKPQEALILLEQTKSQSLQLNKQRFYLTALAYRHLGEYEKALTCLDPSLTAIQGLENEMTLEKGVNLFHLQKFKEAQIYLESLNPQPEKIDLYVLAHLYLLRICLFKCDYASAQTYLAVLNKNLPNEHSLNYEKHYLEGELWFLRKDYIKAASCFEKTILSPSSRQYAWKRPALIYLITSYLKQTEEAIGSAEKLKALFAKAEAALQTLLADSKDDTTYLLQADFYLTRAHGLQDQQAYQQAQQLLTSSPFKTEEGQNQALLKQATAAPTYLERVQLYKTLLQDTHANPLLQAKAYFHQGLNDFEEALLRQKEALLFSTSENLLQQADHAFAQAYQLFLIPSPNQAALALKMQSLACFHHSNDSKKKAWELLQILLQSRLLQTFKEPEEIYALVGLVAIDLISSNPTLFIKANKCLEQGLKLTDNSSWKERLLKIQGKLYLQNKKWTEADTLFAQLLQDYPHSAENCEILFWRAECAKQLGYHSLKKNYLQQLYLSDPQSSYAPSAYFTLYSYREYMRGQRKAIKHLQTMPTFFPDHPLLISAYYLIGLDHMKDHLAEEGLVLRRKNEIAAIDAFQLAESSFDQLAEKNAIPVASLPYFIQLRYRAMLERALANLAIAESSQGGKKQIYLEYAESVFKDLQQILQTPSSLIQTFLIQQDPYPKILEESEFWLAQCYLKSNKTEEADGLFDHLLQCYQKASIQQSYLLSRVWYEKGLLAYQHQNYLVSLTYLMEAEKAAEKKAFLSPDQKLDLWIQQALCYKELKQWDDAMRLLSKIVNDETLSSLRIKAMYLRAEIYDLQGRPELALKQLEATSKKGGEWGKQAKAKLEQTYGY